MLVEKFNKKGRRALIERKDLKTFEKMGFTLDVCPCIEEEKNETIEEVKEEVVAIPIEKPAKVKKEKASAKDKKAPKKADIIL